MNICIITSGILPMPPVKGGAVENLIKAYLDRNEETKENCIEVISCFDSEAAAASKGYKNSKFTFINTSSVFFQLNRYIRGIINKFTNGRLDNAFIHAVGKIVDYDQYDCILIENMPNYVIPIRRRTNKPVYLHLHNDTLNSTHPFAEQILESCTQIWTVSDYIGRRVASIDAGEDQKRKIVTLFNGVDLSLFRETFTASEIEAARAKYSFSQEDKVILFSGRLIPQKGIDKLIMAFNSLADNANTKLLVAGSSFFGLRKKDSFIDYVSSLAKKRERDICFTGYIDYEDMPLLYALSDIVVLPSVWEEPCGLTIIEAVVSGKALITTATGGTPEICRGTQSILLPDDDHIVENLAEKINQLLTSRDTTKAMELSARKSRARLSKERYLSDLCSLFNSSGK